MKKILCPNCHRKVDDITKTCPNCFEDLAQKNFYQKEKRDLLIASRINDEKLIFDAANKLLKIDKNNLLGNYFYSYVCRLQGDNEKSKQFFETVYLSTNEDIREVIYHLIRYKNIYSKEEIKKFITNYVIEGTKIKHYFYILENEDNSLIPIESLPLIDLPIPLKKKSIIPFSLFLIISGIILMVLLFLVVNNFHESYIIFATILLYILPSTITAMGITRLIFNKNKWYITFLFMLVILILTTYYILFPYEKSLIEHIKNVFSSPYDLIMYFIRKVFISI